MIDKTRNVTLLGKRVHLIRKLFLMLLTGNESVGCKLQNEITPNFVDVT